MRISTSLSCETIALRLWRYEPRFVVHTGFPVTDVWYLIQKCYESITICFNVFSSARANDTRSMEHGSAGMSFFETSQTCDVTVDRFRFSVLTPRQSCGTQISSRTSVEKRGLAHEVEALGLTFTSSQRDSHLYNYLIALHHSPSSSSKTWNSE